MVHQICYPFSAKVWQYQGKGGWHFVSLPEELSVEIRNLAKSQEAGWGRLSVKARINEFEWETAIWFDTKLNTYLLPLKAVVRKQINMQLNDLVQVEVLI